MPLINANNYTLELLNIKLIIIYHMVMLILIYHLNYKKLTHILPLIMHYHQ